MNPFSEKKSILDSVNSLLRPMRKPAAGGEDKIYKCKGCGNKYTKAILRENHFVCPSCGHYGKLSARTRITTVADRKSFREFSRSMIGKNPLKFPGYEEKIRDAEKATGLKEAVITGTCTIDGEKAVICVMDSRFLMASMGTAVGEKITRACEYATKKKLPIVVFCASGGARMQEGILSLMQMAKTSAAFGKHGEAGLLFISVLTNPTTGGVTASFAGLGDVILAEPGALIGFAGPRVIEQTIGEKLPEGFQSSEFQLEHGFVDAIVKRENMKETIGRIINLHRKAKGY
ncbi:MAG: acetyl-CoA carboxylase, carboxyltransferase subunit beta [Hornefia sp.]|nr:acetyl-CoA carboxylase, carboxyltransferase subunit beta [Hornefia sp.]